MLQRKPFHIYWVRVGNGGQVGCVGGGGGGTRHDLSHMLGFQFIVYFFQTIFLFTLFVSEYNAIDGAHSLHVF